MTNIYLVIAIIEIGNTRTHLIRRTLAESEKDAIEKIKGTLAFKNLLIANAKIEGLKAVILEQIELI